MSENFTTEMWDLTRLVPFAKNAKKHDPAKITALAGLMKANGFTQPIVAERDGTIIAGHGRRMAALEAGLARVPVFVFQGSKTQADAMRLADNQVVSKDYDVGLLQEEIARLAEEIDVSGLGFSTKELEFLIDPIPDMDTSLFVEDVHAAVEDQREKNEEAAREVDASTAPLADAFGFRRLTVKQSRRVRAFMTQIEAETKAKGADAFMVFLDNLGVAA